MSAEFARAYIKELLLSAKFYEGQNTLHGAAVAASLREQAEVVIRTMHNMGHLVG